MYAVKKAVLKNSPFVPYTYLLLNVFDLLCLMFVDSSIMIA